ncbi:hypothetical protein SAMN06297144_1862 [Sphingomonas guangdongensis]|uniref:Uncharacterized protein n=1 Tax=Sphingomonas guangdongensis TaxID=1141890 RepID=A0A285QXW3_9SPHN|nr:hypothetical protein [Sphingomonas guangdongensis]SOB86753.1 hypothetical protein SAMN06297144_1862 [Sphingomonas guangdongensis]
MSANTRIDSLWDVTRIGSNLAVFCDCGHSSIVDAKRCARWYGVHRFDIRWHVLARHLRCTKCRGRPSHLRVTHQLPTAPDRFPKTEDQWNALIKRQRG